MRQKLHRGRRSVFRKRNPAPRIVAGVLAALAVVALGFFGAKWMSERPAPLPATSTPAVSTPDTSTPTTTTTAPPPATAPTVSAGIRGFYLPHTALTGDGLADTLSAAAKAGFNAVLFDLKDAEGKLYYRFTSPAAVQVNSFTDTALTPAQLAGLFKQIKEVGLMPIPRLYAFRDNAGAKALAAARITHKDNAGWVWYDAKQQNGGRAWLNPYADEAHSYIIDLALELKTAGAAAVMLDGVQFPSQTSSASFGKSSNTSLKQNEVLSLFVKKARTALGDCPVMLCCTGESALGTATKVYGGNPLTFGAAVASPILSKDVQASVEKMILRTQVLPEADKPLLAPLLSTAGLTAGQVNEQMAFCRAGGAQQFILYTPDGHYDFGGYKLP